MGYQREENVIAIDGTNVSVSSSAETIVYSVLIPAYTFRGGDIVEYYYRVGRTNGLTGLQKYTCYFNTTNNLSGTPIFLTSRTTTATAENVCEALKYIVFKSDTSIEHYTNGDSDDTVFTNTRTTSTYNSDINYYFIITIQCGVTASPITLTTYSGSLITRLR